MIFKPNLIVLSILITAAVASGCTFQRPSGQVLPTVTPAIESVEPQSTTTPDGKLKAQYDFIAEKDNQLAFDLLTAGADVETKDFGEAGKMVTSVNGLASTNEYYWAFYVNGEYAQQGVSNTFLKKGDRMQFIYEAVTPLR